MFGTRRICRSTRTVVLAGALIGFFMALPAFGSTTTVTNTNDSGPGSLRDAIATAAPGDTIDFGVTGTITLTSTLVIDKSLTIRGPGAASLSVSGNDSVVVFVTAYNTNVTISGLTVTKGFNAHQGGWGGGIVNRGSMTVSDCVITRNTIPAGGGPGGGIFNYSSLKLINSIVSGNSAAYGGGGVWNNGNATLEIVDSTISANSTVGDGAGVSNVGGTVTIIRTHFSGNTTPNNGGGVANNGTYGTLTVIDSTFSGNSNNGICSGCNSTQYPGSLGTQHLTITGSTFSGNTSAGFGGGIVSWGTTSITNSTFASNTAYQGGGVYVYTGQTKISNSTFSGNRAITYGGGVFGAPILKNTVLADSGAAGNCFVFVAATSAGHNLSDDSSCVSGFIKPGDLNGVPAGLDPAGLQDNGGATKTFALVSGSPALDAIPVSACTGVDSHAVTTDQRGISRPQGSACDMGSFEALAPSDTTPPSFSGVPANQSLEATGPGGAPATWTNPTASDDVSGSVAVSCSHTSGSTFPLGTTTVTCSATDAAGNSSSVGFSIAVQDTTAPAIASVTPSTRVLWPPNHQLVPVSVTVQSSDAVSSPVCTIMDVTSSEPDNGLGDGDTPNDIQGISGLTVQLRAERSGRGTSRVYAIAISCVDAAGNATQSSTTVAVPHSQQR